MSGGYANVRLKNASGKTGTISLGANTNDVMHIDNDGLIFLLNDKSENLTSFGNTDVKIGHKLLDKDGDEGVSGQMLISTNTGVDWINKPTASGDNWGTQYVITDGTMSGKGTSTDPLKVVSAASLWSRTAGVIHPSTSTDKVKITTTTQTLDVNHQSATTSITVGPLGLRMLQRQLLQGQEHLRSISSISK